MQEEEQTRGEGGGNSRWEKGRGRRIPPGKRNRFLCGVFPCEYLLSLGNVACKMHSPNSGNALLNLRPHQSEKGVFH